MKVRPTIGLCGVALMLLVALADVSPLVARDEIGAAVSAWDVSGIAIGADTGRSGSARRAVFDPVLVVEAVLPPGALGLIGEPVTWVITVGNAGDTPGSDVLVTGTLPGELRIDSAEAERGQIAISEQAVVFSVPLLNPGETIQMRLNTTVIRSPANGVLVGEAMLSGTGPGGVVTRRVASELFVPTELPATGYAPGEEFPGQGEPSALAVGLMMVGVVAVGVAIVWFRGRRW